MSVFTTIVSALSGPKAKTPVPEVKFYKEAALYGEHGKIVVSNRYLGLDAQEVTFVLANEVKLRPLTPEFITLVFESAKAQGFIPHEITAYRTRAVIVVGDDPTHLPADTQGVVA